MSFRFSIGSRWFEFYLFSALMLGAMDILFIQYGHNSTKNLIRVMRDQHGRVLFRWRKGKIKTFRRAKI